MPLLKSYEIQTNQGPLLNLNEDYVHVDLKNNLFFLLDGLGGSNIGDQAVLKIANCLKQFFSKFGGDPDSTMPFAYSHKYLLEGNALLNAMHYAHVEILKFNEGRAMSSRGGGSGVAAVLSEDILTLASAGNCIAYLLRDHVLYEILSPDIVARPSLAYERFNFQTFPLSGFGFFTDIHISVKELKLEAGDTLLFFSDGVYSNVFAEDIEDFFSQERPLSEKIIPKLFKLANERGNKDNQSGIVLHF